MCVVIGETGMISDISLCCIFVLNQNGTGILAMANMVLLKEEHTRLCTGLFK